MDDQKALKKRLKKLMSRAENVICSDCPERAPRWASLIVPPPGSPHGTLPIGAFCCLECSGSHRRLGVHISFVRSINLDSWSEKHVQAMERGGNKKVNEIFEAHLNARKPAIGASGSVRERFIRDKYERRKFYDPNVFARYNQEGSGDDDSDEEEEQQVRNQRKPSEAALRRRQQQQKDRSTKPSVRKSNPKPAPAALAPPPVVDLLDFGAFDSNPFPATTATIAPVTFPATTPAVTAPPQAPTPAPTPAPAPAPRADFGDFSAFAAPIPSSTQETKEEPKKSTTNIDIMSMYSTGAAMTPVPMVGAGGGMIPNTVPNAGIVSMMGNNNPMMMGATKTAPSGNNNIIGMMQQMQLNNNNQSSGLSPNQQQMMNMMQMQQQMQQQMQMNPQAALMYQQQQQMMMQQKMMMMAAAQQGGNNQNNSMGNNFQMNQAMMMNQQQQVNPGMNNMMMNNAGAFTSNGSSMSSTMQQQQPARESEPEKEDPFAQFSAF